MRQPLFLGALFLFASFSIYANNIQVSNVDCLCTPGDDVYEVNFDISWENSWRTSSLESNYDAAWVFVKWRITGTPEWQHGVIDYINAIPSGSEIILPSDQVGVFIQRIGDGIGDVSFENVSLGLSLDELLNEDDVLEVSVFAIEMVFVPQGAYQLGDGLALGSQNDFARGGSTSSFTMDSEFILSIGGISEDNLSIQPNFDEGCDGPDDFNTSTVQTLPAAFPKGFAAFYAMKYEISEGQYAAFLNALTPEQAAVRSPPGLYGFRRYSIRSTGTTLKYISDSPEQACNLFSWVDFALYADWAGLRPMSELEYEKVCRGTRPSVPGEFAWGTDIAFNEEYVFEFENTENERAINGVEGLGNCISNSSAGSGLGPRRTGLFAETLGSGNRVSSGASYYGLLDLTGNLFEIVICIGTPEGRAFEGEVHGDGTISLLGISSWPALINSGPGTVGRGMGIKGGSYESSLDMDYHRVSNRCLANLTLGVERGESLGGRLVRSNF